MLIGCRLKLQLTLSGANIHPNGIAKYIITVLIAAENMAVTFCSNLIAKLVVVVLDSSLSAGWAIWWSLIALSMIVTSQNAP